jgi:SNF2 family DNA or RNA helicase
MPGYLHSYSRFQALYEKPISIDGNAEALARLSSLIAPFLLRRLKKDVLKELPPKFDSRMSTEMTDEQKKIYVAQLTLAKREVAEELAVNGAERGRIRILSILTRLRQICCHPASFMPEYTGDSGKMQLLAEIVEDALESGHRLLVFSQFTSILAIIRTWADAQGIPYAYLDGSTPVGERSDLVRRFNAGAGSIFLISLKAGGTGLNLTGADMVVHFDPWWNPAVEDQATDRAYRIGQKQSVQVIKLISKGTIEEKVIEMQQRKKGLIDSILRPGETFLSRLTEDEILDLFEIRETVANKKASAISP